MSSAWFLQVNARFQGLRHSRTNHFSILGLGAYLLAKRLQLKKIWTENVGPDPCGSGGLLTRGLEVTDLLDDAQRFFE